mgnify:FL=1
MAVTVKVLVPSKSMEATQQIQYTADNANAIIDKFTVTNVTANNVSFSVNIVATGGTASPSNQIIKDRTLAPNESYICPALVGHAIDRGGFISTIASAASSLTMRVSGREIT